MMQEYSPTDVDVQKKLKASIQHITDAIKIDGTDFSVVKASDDLNEALSFIENWAEEMIVENSQQKNRIWKTQKALGL